MSVNFSQEEEDWLDALEAGELDDFGRLKQEKDTSMMTARQVSLYNFIIIVFNFASFFFLVIESKLFFFSQRAMLGHEIQGENELVELPTCKYRILYKPTVYWDLCRLLPPKSPLYCRNHYFVVKRALLYKCGKRALLYLWEFKIA